MKLKEKHINTEISHDCTKGRNCTKQATPESLMEL